MLAFLFQYFDPALLLAPTTTTGGDLASHYYPAQYFRDFLLPKLKTYGWSQAHYCGYPIFLFYFPLAFWLIILVSFFAPLALAFKWVSVLGIFLMPFATYQCLKILRYEFPIPITASVLMIPLLFNQGNSMWGGNIASTLAGEFSYQIGLVIFVYFMASLYRGIEEFRSVIKNSLLVAALGLTHGYSYLFAIALAPFFLLSSPKGMLVKRLLYLVWVYSLGTGLIGFWLLPVLVNQPYTIPFKWTWDFRFHEAFPSSLQIFLPFSAAAVFLKAMDLIPPAQLSKTTRLFLARTASLLDKRFVYFAYSCAAGILLFLMAFELEVIDIRFVPFIQIFVLIGAAIGFWTLFGFLKNKVALTLLFSAAALSCATIDSRFVSHWIDWNYSGFEAKRDWPVFKEINDFVKGSFREPRIAVEPSDKYEDFGTIRAFESLPLFSGRQTLEGLYMQSALLSPFVFYQQAEMSELPPCPYIDYHYARFNFAKGLAHLKLLNVRDVILASPKAQAAAAQSEELRLKKMFGDIGVYELLTNENRFVIPLQYHPFIFKTRRWKRVAYDWFRKIDLAAVPLIFNAQEKDQRGDLKNVPVISSLDEIQKIPLDRGKRKIQVKESVEEEEIRIETSHIGHPLLIKIMYHPNWQVEGADKIYLASPAFMIVYPENHVLRLSFGKGKADHAGLFLTLGVLATIVLVKIRRNSFPLAAGIPGDFLTRHHAGAIMLMTFLLILLGGWGAVRYYETPLHIYNRGLKLFEKQDYDRARRQMEKFIKGYPEYSLGDEAHYFFALSAYLRQDYESALEDFDGFMKLYPDSYLAAEIVYHKGLALLNTQRPSRAREALSRVIADYPDTEWARFASDQIREMESG